MIFAEKIIRSVPFFRHASSAEISALAAMSRVMRVGATKELSIKTATTMNIVLKGVFELEALGSTDLVYMAPGSCFGVVPFSTNRLRGKVRALTHAEVLMIEIQELYRFFFSSFQFLRGYLVTLERLGFPVNETGSRYLAMKSRVVAVTGRTRGSGKTVMAALASLALSGSSKVILVDLSREGESAFSLLGALLSAPLSQRWEGDDATKSAITERIVPVTDNLSVLNVAAGSSVAVDAGILAPLMAVLAVSYTYIIFDIGSSDEELALAAMALADDIHYIFSGHKNLAAEQGFLDRAVQGGQRVYGYRNLSLWGASSPGIIDFEKLSFSSGGTSLEKMTGASSTPFAAALAERIRAPRRALVFESNLLDGVILAGFAGALFAGKNAPFDVIYSSAYSYTLAVMALLLPDRNSYRREIHGLLDEHRVNRNLEVMFPREHIFGAGPFRKYFSSLAGSARIEQFSVLPLALLAESGSGRARHFSTGNLADVLASSMLIEPYFEAGSVAGGLFSSGYPVIRVTPELFARRGADEISLISVSNSGNLAYYGGRVLPFYEKILQYLAMETIPQERSETVTRHHVIDANHRDMKIDRLLDHGEREAEKFLGSLGS